METPSHNSHSTPRVLTVNEAHAVSAGKKHWLNFALQILEHVLHANNSKRKTERNYA